MIRYGTWFLEFRFNIRFFFNIPSIKGYEGGTYRLVKVDENGKGLGGATFTLTHVPHDETCTNGHVHSCDDEWSVSVVSDNDGYVHFQNIQPHMFNRCHWAIFLPHTFLFTYTFTIHLQIDAVLL